MGVGQLSESDAVDALRLPFYSSSHPTGSHGWRNQFDLGDSDLDHYCIVVEPTDLADVASKLQELGVEMAPTSPFRPEDKGGPVDRWGAHGIGTSLYVYDPDENVVELRYY